MFTRDLIVVGPSRQSHWKTLTLFPRSPGASLDNNVCERALKKATGTAKTRCFMQCCTKRT